MRPRKIIYIYCADPEESSLMACRVYVWGFRSVIVQRVQELRLIKDEFPAGCILWMPKVGVEFVASIPLVQVSNCADYAEVRLAVTLAAHRKKGPKPALNRTALLALQAGKKAA